MAGVRCGGPGGPIISLCGDGLVVYGPRSRLEAGGPMGDVPRIPGEAVSGHARGGCAMGEADEPAGREAPAARSPMAVAVGVDLLERARLRETHARFGDRFLRRVFTET